MKLLLDEHLSPEIADQLRARGHDVVAVGQRADLRGRSDRLHFATQLSERRVIVTRDVADFRPMLAEALRRGSATYGLICVPRRFPLDRDGIGRIVTALAGLLEAHPEVDAAITLGGEIWLHDVASA